jgi:hypothetical protein
MRGYAEADFILVTDKTILGTPIETAESYMFAMRDYLLDDFDKRNPDTWYVDPNNAYKIDSLNGRKQVLGALLVSEDDKPFHNLGYRNELPDDDFNIASDMTYDFPPEAGVKFLGSLVLASSFIRKPSASESGRHELYFAKLGDFFRISTGDGGEPLMREIGKDPEPFFPATRDRSDESSGESEEVMDDEEDELDEEYYEEEGSEDEQAVFLGLSIRSYSEIFRQLPLDLNKGETSKIMKYIRKTISSVLVSCWCDEASCRSRIFQTNLMSALFEQPIDMDQNDKNIRFRIEDCMSDSDVDRLMLFDIDGGYFYRSRYMVREPQKQVSFNTETTRIFR